MRLYTNIKKKLLRIIQFFMQIINFRHSIEWVSNIVSQSAILN